MSLTTFQTLMSVSSFSNGMGKWWNKTDEWIEWWKSKKEEKEEESDSEEEESDSEEEESDSEEKEEESDSEEEESDSEEEVNTTTVNPIPKPLPAVLEAITTSTLLTTTSTLLTTTSTTKTPEITTSLFQNIKEVLIEGINETMVNEAQATLDNIESEKSNLVYIVPSIIGSVSLISFSLFLIFRKDKQKVLVDEIPVSTEEDLYLQPIPTLERDEHLYETPLDEFTSEDHLYEFSHPTNYRKKVEGMEEVEEETGLYDLATLEQPVYNLASEDQGLYDLASNN